MQKRHSKLLEIEWEGEEKEKKKGQLSELAKGIAQCGARTHDHQIKSLVLYRLS